MGVKGGVAILEHMEFTQPQDEEVHVGGFCEKQLHLLHLNINKLLVEDSRIWTVRLIEQLRRLPSVVDEMDVGALPLILTSFAIHGVIQ